MAAETTKPLSAVLEAGRADDADLPRLVIEPPRGVRVLDWRELWRHRDLLYFLTWRDIKLRYKQTIFGAAWALLQPLLTMAIFAGIFGRIGSLTSATHGVPYALYVFVGLLPWLFFSNGVTNAASSVVSSANLITKVYFPRLIIPFASVGVAVVDFAVSFIVLGILFAIYHWLPSWQVLLLPIVLVGLTLFCLGVGGVLAALNVAYRDFRFVVPFLLQVWMFLTPVIYSPEIIPPRFRWLLSLNPVAGLVEGFRAAVLGTPVATGTLTVAMAVSALCFVMGISYFRAVERRFADII